MDEHRCVLQYLISATEDAFDGAWTGPRLLRQSLFIVITGFIWISFGALPWSAMLTWTPLPLFLALRVSEVDVTSLLTVTVYAFFTHNLCLEHEGILSYLIVQNTNWINPSKLLFVGRWFDVNSRFTVKPGIHSPQGNVAALFVLVEFGNWADHGGDWKCGRNRLQADLCSN